MKKALLVGMMALMMVPATAQQLFNEMVYTPQQTTFTLFAPADRKPVVRLYREGMGGKALNVLATCGPPKLKATSWDVSIPLISGSASARVSLPRPWVSTASVAPLST